jgi:uncharacterized protein (DUF302 family)
MANLEGYRTYIAAIALFLIGIVGYIDPSAAAFVAQQTDIEPATILLICGLLMAGLRKITAKCAVPATP